MKSIENRIVVRGDGNQAPYGIGEIIETFANTDAGLKKAGVFARKYYNRPAIILPDGRRQDPDRMGDEPRHR